MFRADFVKEAWIVWLLANALQTLWVRDALCCRALDGFADVLIRSGFIFCLLFLLELFLFELPLLPLIFPPSCGCWYDSDLDKGFRL